jgi:hypothetical protein
MKYPPEGAVLFMFTNGRVRAGSKFPLEAAPIKIYDDLTYSKVSY